MSNPLFEPPRRGLNVLQIWSGIIAAAPPDFDEKVFVLIPGEFGETRIGPCMWQARNTVDLPARGDVCLVVFDQNNQPFVPLWWPFA